MQASNGILTYHSLSPIMELKVILDSAVLGFFRYDRKGDSAEVGGNYAGATLTKFNAYVTVTYIYLLRMWQVPRKRF